MNRRSALLVCAVIVVVLTSMLLFRVRPAKPDSSQVAKAKSRPAAASTANKGLSSESTPTVPTPALFKSTRYPPETSEEKALWEWWRAAGKADDHFEWKMPIHFYGRVIDQFGNPVSSATVACQWNVVGGVLERPLTSDGEGYFALEGVRGKGLSVDVRKKGYVRTTQSSGSFEYAAFFQENFHVAERERPVIFRLQKLLGAEPTYVYRVQTTAKANGAPVQLSVEKGAFDSAGEFEFYPLLVERGPKGPEYTVTVRARNGASLAPTSEEFPFLAPEQGYQPTLTLRRTPDDPNYRLRDDLKFYAKLADGRFAYVGMEVTVVPGSDEVRFYGGVRRNVNWSRNLEFDHRKWINR